MTNTSVSQVVAEFKAAHPQLNGRIDRGAALAQQPGAVIEVAFNVWQVASRSGGQPHQVEFSGRWSCDCKDCQGSGYHPAPVVEFCGSTQPTCMHIIAAAVKWLCGDDIQAKQYQDYISLARRQVVTRPVATRPAVKDAYLADFGLTDEQLAITPGHYKRMLDQEQARRAGVAQ